MPYADGTFTTFKQVGPTRVSYPLLNYPTKDKTVKQYDITGWILPASYTPANALSTYPGDGTFAADNVAYLTAESEPQDGGGYYVVERSYTNIPNAQTRWGSRLLVVPVLHDITSSNYYAVSFDDGNTSSIYAARKAVTSVAAAEATYLNPTNTRAAAQGHYAANVEMNNSAQSFYLDDSDATIKTALSTAFNGDNTYYANFYVSRWNYGVYLSWAGISVTTKKITITDEEIEISDRTVALGAADSNGPIEFISAQTFAASVRALTSTAHGGAVGNRVALYSGARIVAMSTVQAVTANTFSVFTKDIPESAIVIDSAVFDKDAALRYVAGPVPVSTKITETFYLPGVSGGITTPADITLAAPQTDPVSWFGLLTSSATYAVIDGAELEQWRGPIFRVTKTEADMSDAKISVAITA